MVQYVITIEMRDREGEERGREEEREGGRERCNNVVRVDIIYTG